MNNRERMIQKIEAEKDQDRRILMCTVFLAEYASNEVKNIIDGMLDRILQDGKNSAAICADALMELDNIQNAG